MSVNNLRDEFLVALRAGASANELLAIVLRHKSRGLSQRATYATMEDIRMESGCHKDAAKENPLCERLEDIMDRVWGYCPQTDAIWDSSLSEAKGE